MQRLDDELLNFEHVIAEHLPSDMASSPIARAIREIWATRGASAVLSCVQSAFPEATDIACTRTVQFSLRPALPTPAQVKCAAPLLVNAVISQERAAAIEALAQLGVFELCPLTDDKFGRLEVSVGSIVGRVRLIPLVELGVLAAQLGFYERASAYVAQAHTLSPEPAQLHDLHTVSGVVALSGGDLRQGTEHLAASARVCSDDGFAFTAWSVLEPNLMLANRLLDHGQEADVLLYLERCLRIWRYDAERIGGWIGAIKAGERPDFSQPGRLGLRGPAQKMRNQILLGSFLPETPFKDIYRGSFEEFREEVRDEIKRAVKGKLNASEN